MENISTISVLAADIVLCAGAPQEIHQMLQELSDESTQKRLRMNISKTKVMTEDDNPIYVNNNQVQMWTNMYTWDSIIAWKKRTKENKSKDE